MNWEAYAWIGWLALFGVFEALGLALRHKNEGMTLTYFIETHIPRWALAALLGWLCYHFVVAGMSKG